MFNAIGIDEAHKRWKINSQMHFAVWINLHMKGIRCRKLQIYGIQVSLATSLNAWRHSQRQQPQILIDLRSFATSALLRSYVTPPKNTPKHTHTHTNEKRVCRCMLRSVVYHQHSLSTNVHPVRNAHRCRSINLRNLHHRKSIKISSSGRVLKMSKSSAAINQLLIIGFILLFARLLQHTTYPISFARGNYSEQWLLSPWHWSVLDIDPAWPIFGISLHSKM